MLMFADCVDPGQVAAKEQCAVGLHYFYRHSFSYTQSTQFLIVEVPLKLLISQSKFSVPRKFILRYQQSEVKVVKGLIGNVSKL